ncbi:hypothetical protein CONPUDRAFT_152891 [Coniophora puteana RWD-64-598 SS2]|uniref:Uncharacterized protein n=1 Tax=Coniophora puteana (strain RWD-64-598) TaxID=741705 RepID=A0A5M3MS64_CONPW|nr:uncharacterized protein CONPUDRAFT_152891 [Coniophora puteana RWD-64-598 SS2]EIW81999.1 hypothetical protein CONPUDRAFT_152891 [Coniophora puteana RWD-64-598 SS2]
MGDGMPRLLTDDEFFALVQAHGLQVAADETAKEQQSEAQTAYDEAVAAWQEESRKRDQHNEQAGQGKKKSLKQKVPKVLPLIFVDDEPGDAPVARVPPKPPKQPLPGRKRKFWSPEYAEDPAEGTNIETHTDDEDANLSEPEKPDEKWDAFVQRCALRAKRIKCSNN